MKLTASEMESLRAILKAVYLSDFGSGIVDDARTILAKLPCHKCGRRYSRAAGCPDWCTA